VVLKKTFLPLVLAHACSGRWAHAEARALGACRGTDACMQRIWPLAALSFFFVNVFLLS